MLAVGNAQQSVWIQSPYFVPEVGLYDTMVNAALSGVDVRFMMTGVPDKKVPFWAAWTYFRPLLEAGVKVYLYEAGFLHAKTLTADGQITAIGTMNMDIRSLRLHKELMLWMYDDEVARRQEQLFQADIANAHEVTFADLDMLGPAQRFRNSFMRLLSYFI
jgi:cardiolipin synthase